MEIAMKQRLFACLLAALLLAAAVPAAAYTDRDMLPYTVTIELMDTAYSLMGDTTFTPQEPGRAYVRNEIACAMISLFVPAGASYLQDGYTRLVIRAQGAQLHIAENYGSGSDDEPALQFSKNVRSTPAVTALPQYNGFSISLQQAQGDAQKSDLFFSDQDQTYHIAIFFQITGRVELSATLTGDGFMLQDQSPFISTMMLPGDFAITRDTTPLNMHDVLFVNKTVYTVEELAGTGHRMHVVSNGKTDEVEQLVFCYQYASGKLAEYRIAMVGGSPCFFALRPPAGAGLPNIAWANGDDAQRRAYLQLMSIYQSLAVDAFGLDWSQTQHSLKSFFGEDLLRTNDIEASLFLTPER